jgi:hypothetical protein
MTNERCEYLCRSRDRIAGLAASRLLLTILGVALLTLSLPIDAWCHRDSMKKKI